MQHNAKAEEARRIVESELWKEVIASTRQRLKDEWEREPSEAARDRLWHKLQAIPEVEKELRKTIQHGVTDKRLGRSAV